MDTEPDLNRQMSDLARALRSQASSEDALQRVVAASLDLIPGCVSAGVSLARRQGRIVSAAGTDARHRRSDELQQQLAEGPCMDAVWDHEVVRSRDLLEEPRWPTWGPRAMQELGVRSMLCLRLFTHEDRVGALNLFSDQSDAFTDDDLQTGQAIAAHAAVAVAAADEIHGLQTALDTRTTIARATGIVMAEYTLTDTQAWDLLLRLSSETNTKIATVARRVVTTHNAKVKGPTRGPA